MTKNTKAKRDDPEQSRLFLKKAREIEANEKDASAADRLLNRLVRTKPDPKTKKIRS